MGAAHSRLLSVESEKVPLFLTGSSSAVRTALLALVVFVVSYLTDMVADTTIFSIHGIWLIGSTNGLLVAVMLLMPRKTWPVPIAAGMAAQVAHDLHFGFPPRAIGLFALGATIEFLIIGLGLGYSFDGVPRLNSLKALGKYCFFAAFLAPFVSAFIGASAISGSYAVNWRVWFFGEMLAFLTLTPAILGWASARRVWIHGSPHSTVEAAWLLSTLAILGYVVLLAPWKTLSSALLWCFVPLLLWAALRFGSLGVSTCAIVISFLSIWGTMHGHGPFAEPEPLRNVLSLQLFLILATTPFMTLAAVAEDRERARLVEKELSRRLISAQEQERIRIARELHDDVCQRLAVLSLRIEKATKGWGSGRVSVGEQLEQIWQHCSVLTGDVQALSHALHPSILDNLGLITAVKSFCRELSEQSGVEVNFTAQDVQDPLPQEVSLSIFRVIQEALHNAAKYSGQKTFEVHLRGAVGNLELEVLDRGIGFDLSNVKSNDHLGLVSMSERIDSLGGKFQIDSKPMEGTRIYAVVPVAVRSSAAGAN